ncbi:MAG: tetratricopeptide repeat protein [Candidatus Omnitrophota bacterium]
MEKKTGSLGVCLSISIILSGCMLLFPFVNAQAQAKDASPTVTADLDSVDSAISKDKLINLLRKAKDELLLSQQALLQLKELCGLKEQENKSLNEKIFKLQDDFKSFQELINRLTQEKEFVQGKQKEASSQLSDLETVRVVLSGEVESLKKEIEQLRDKFTRVESERTELNLKLNALKKKQIPQKEFDNLRDKLSEAVTERVQLQEEVNTLKKKVVAQKDIDALRLRASEFDEERSRLVNDLKEKDMRFKELSVVSQEVHELREKLSLVEEERDKLKEDTARLKKEIITKRDFDAMRDKASKLEGERSHLQQEAAELKKQLISQKDIEKLREKFSELEEVRNSLQSEVKSLKAQVGSEDDIARVRSKFAALEDERNVLQEQVGALKKQLGSEKDVSVLRNKVVKLEEERDQLRDEGAALKKQLPLQKDLDQLRVKLAKVESERDQLEAQAEELKKQVGSKSDSAQLRQQLVKLEAERNLLRQEALNSKNKIVSSQEVEQLKNKSAQSQKERLAAQKEIDELKSSQAVLSAQLKESKEKESALTQGVSDNVFVQQIHQLQKDLKVAQELSGQLIQEKAVYQSQENVSGVKIKALESENTVLEAQYQDCMQKNLTILDERTRISEQLARAMVRLSDAENLKAGSTVQVQNYQQKTEQLLAQISQGEKERSALQRECDEFKRQLGELYEQITKLKTNKEQDRALLDAEIEQVKAHKDGEWAQLNDKFREFKLQKEADIRAITEAANKNLADLSSSQELSYQLVQEKSSLLNQQKQNLGQLKELETQRILLTDENKKLLEQNTFLKNQYVAVSEQVNDLQNQFARLEKEKEKMGGMPPPAMTKKVADLETSKNELLEKTKEYNRKLQDYEQRVKNKEEVEKQYKELMADYQNLKNNYDQLTQRFKVTEEAKERHQTLTTRYAELPEENTVLRYNLGVMYAQKQEYTKAIKEFEKVLELKPDDAESHYNLGVIFGEQLNNRKKAIFHFRKYLALAPNDQESEQVRRFVLTWETADQDLKNGR